MEQGRWSEGKPAQEEDQGRGALPLGPSFAPGLASLHSTAEKNELCIRAQIQMLEVPE